MFNFYLFGSTRSSSTMLNDKEIEVLSKVMRNAKPSSSSIPAGMTYIGQLISHDIVKPSKANQDPAVDSKENTIRQIPSAALNLSSIYGDPTKTLDKTGKFRLEESFSTNNKTDSPSVVDADKPPFPESRNRENFIIAQLHLFFNRLHNQIVDDLGCEKEDYPGEKARALVCHLFLRIVKEEYLSTILSESVYNYYFQGDDIPYHLLKEESAEKEVFEEVPVEFSHAAFRMGHSMVRPQYHLRSKQVPIKLKDIFSKGGQLEIKTEIDWRVFFANKNGKNRHQEAGKIDLRIADHMKDIPDHLGIRESIDIIKINIQRGKELELMSGHDAVNHIINIKGLPPELRPDTSIFKDRTGFNSTTFDFQSVKIKGKKLTKDEKEDVSKITPARLPLWLAILFEAEKTELGNRLGKLGSIIIAETLKRSIETSDYFDAKDYNDNLEKLGFPVDRGLQFHDLIDFLEKKQETENDPIYGFVIQNEPIVGDVTIPAGFEDILDDYHPTEGHKLSSEINSDAYGKFVEFTPGSEWSDKQRAALVGRKFRLSADGDFVFSTEDIEIREGINLYYWQIRKSTAKGAGENGTDIDTFYHDLYWKVDLEGSEGSGSKKKIIATGYDYPRN